MQARNRYRQLDEVSGQIKTVSPFSGTTYTYRTYTSDEEWCDDVVGNFGGNNPLLVRHRQVIGSIFNGRVGTQEWKNYPSDFVNRSHWNVPPIEPKDSMEALVTRLLASTNPNRVTVNVPVFWAELRDLPAMIRHAGLLLLKFRNPRLSWRSGLSVAKEAAAANLAYQFGWRPLVSDLMSMFKFTEAVSKRTSEFERLFSKGGLKRRLTLEESNAAADPVSQRLEFGKYAIVQSTAQLKVWGSVRWKPTGVPPSNLKWKAAQAYYGLSLDNISTAIWEGLPWSWLIDYFGNVGQYLQATRNLVPCVPTHVSIMMTKTWHSNHGVQLYNNANLICEEGNAIVVDKLRYPQSGVPTINFHMPFLTGNQMGILSSLMVAKFRPF